MRAIMVSRDIRVMSADWPAREALAVDLRLERMIARSFSMCRWAVLKFLRASS